MDIVNFDPSGANFGQKPVSSFMSTGRSEDAILTIKITRVGATGKSLPYQLFGALNGIHTAVNTAQFPTVVPADSYEVVYNGDNWLRKRLNNVLAGAVASADFNAFKVFCNATIPTGSSELMSEASLLPYTSIAQWLPDGSLRIGDPIAVIGGSAVIISCEEVPYRVLMDNLKTSVLLVNQSRMTYNDQTSLSKSWGFVYGSMFGSDTTNNLVPQRYFDPNQQQARIVDINTQFYIDAEMSLNSSLASAETEISIALFVSKFEKNAVRIS